MPSEILLMISAFIAGTLFDYFNKGKELKIRLILHQIAIVYLLFKIGFLGGGELISQQWQTVFFQSIIAIIVSSFWTLLVLILLKRWSSFEPITQIVVATHFGSVSVGTFIAAIAFLEAMHITVNPSVVIWLSMMEFPAIIIGMWKLGVRAKTLFLILKEKWSLAILPLSIILGIVFEKSMPSSIKSLLSGRFFMFMLLYFLFEMGCKASASLESLKKDMRSVIFVGIVVPILGGISGSSIGYLIGYSTGGMFIMAILMASASYVLAPLSMYEVLKGIYKTKPHIARHVVATSMALSVGVTLPFNVLVGFELYYFVIKAIQSSPVLALFGLGLPLALGIISIKRQPK